MRTLKFHYGLAISFDAPVHDHSYTLRCCPFTDERQSIRDLEVDITPKESLSEDRDSFGNHILFGAVREPHTRFEVVVRGTAVTGLSDSLPGDALKDYLYRLQTPLTAPDGTLCLAAEELPAATPRETAHAVMALLQERMRYTQGVTGVDTTAAEVFARGQGVCQDYAHVMLSLLRQKGIACRYVVGMVTGEGMSHAWVEVQENNRWYGYDPTNDLVVTDRHIAISHGRDYRDCVINNGVFYGNALQKQEISVIVQDN